MTHWLLSRASKPRKMSVLREMEFSEMAIPVDTIVEELGVNLPEKGTTLVLKECEEAGQAAVAVL